MRKEDYILKQVVGAIKEDLKHNNMVPISTYSYKEMPPLNLEDENLLKLFIRNADFSNLESMNLVMGQIMELCCRDFSDNMKGVIGRGCCILLDEKFNKQMRECLVEVKELIDGNNGYGISYIDEGYESYKERYINRTCFFD